MIIIMNQCSICNRKRSLFCPNCVEGMTAPKVLELNQIDRDIENRNQQVKDYVSSLMKNETQQLIQSTQLMRTLKKKAKLKQLIRDRTQSLRNKKQNQEVANTVFRKRGQLLMDLKEYYKQMESRAEGIKYLTLTFRKQSQALKNENAGLVESKSRDIEYAFFDEGDAKIVQSLMEIQESDEIVLNQAYTHYDVLEAVKCETIKLKVLNSQLLSFQEVGVIQRNIGMLACVLRIFRLWVPHQMKKVCSSIQIKKTDLIMGPYSKVFGVGRLEISIQYLNAFQANLQFLSKSLNTQERPMVCLSRYFLRKIVEESNRTGQRICKASWRTSLDCLKADSIEFYFEDPYKNHLDQCLPPLYALSSDSEEGHEETDQFQLLA